MSKENYKRVRNHTIAFRVSDEERNEIRAKVAIIGLPIGEFLLESVMNQKIYIAVGKYQSDRLSIEVRRLREQLETTAENLDEVNQVVQKCICLIEQLLKVIENEDGGELNPEDFRTIKQSGMTAKRNKNVPAGNRDNEE